MVQASPAVSREPPQDRSKQHYQHNSNPEIGGSDTQSGEKLAEVVDDGITFDGGQDAQGYADYQRQGKGGGRQLQGSRQALKQHLPGRALQEVRGTEIGPYNVRQEIKVLDNQRPVQSELFL